MTIEEFITAAIEGGYDLAKRLDLDPSTTIIEENSEKFSSLGNQKDYINIGIAEFPSIILDPEAWKTVGKVKGWDTQGPVAKLVPFMWERAQRDMIISLQNGSTLEEYIATL